MTDMPASPFSLLASAAPLNRLRNFLTLPEARPALLGCLGALLITVGGLGSGSTRLHDPVLESASMSWLRFGHGLVVSAVTLWCGVGLVLIAWIWLGRCIIARRTDVFSMVVTTVLWTVPLLVSAPVFSRDTYSYLAQGALLRDGFDPYVVGPVQNPNVLLDEVSSVWTTTPAPYGPVFILIAKYVTILVGNNVVAGTILLRVCMLPGLALLIWATSRVAAYFGADRAVAMWICVLNPLVLIHLMGGVHNEMLMVGLMMAGIALTLERHPVAGIAAVAVGVAVKATAGLALPFLLWVWARQLRERRHVRPTTALVLASAFSAGIFAVVFVAMSALAGVGLGWLTALTGSLRVINWLTVPTAAANVINVVLNTFGTGQFYAVIGVTRLIGVGIILVTLPLLWWRFRHDDREALTGIAWAMIVVVLFVPAALPWYYSWPLAVMAPLAQSRAAMAAIAGVSTWIMVIFKPDGSHGMYSWLHVAIATACAVAAWYVVSRPPVSRPEPERDAPLRELDESATRQLGERS
jgi:alpha-1,6-mannosyltransferase